MKELKKQYKIPSKKKFDHPYHEVANVGEHIEMLANHGDRILYAWPEKGEVRELSYADFAQTVKDLTMGLAEIYGQGAGRKIVIIGETSARWVASYLAVIASGNVAVPMDKELAHGEISKFFDVADTSAVFYSGTFNKVFAEMAKEKENLLLIPMDDEAETETEKITFSELAEKGQNSLLPYTPDTDTERPCEYLFTSGTTGTSKCVMLCQRNIFTTAMAACASVDFTPDEVLVSVLPIHHTYELTCTHLAGPNFGLKICINDSLRHVIPNFKKFQPTALVLVPLFVSTMYKKIMAEAKRSGKDKALVVLAKVAHKLSFVGIDLSKTVFKDVREAFGGRLEKIICGGAALSPEMIPMFQAFGISIYEGYGITECSPLVAVTPYYNRKPGSVGPACPCCEVRIEGTETNDQGFLSGEIQVRGTNVMLGYRDNDEANEAAFTDDGWFRTGDVGYLDDQGNIYITGRMKSVIVLDNGKNVFPEEIEEYLEGIDYIAESVVIGREEDDGCKLTAVIFPNYEKYAELSETEIRGEIQKAIAALNKRLPSFKQIHKLEFRKTEFEKTTTRKIKRHLVK